MRQGRRRDRRALSHPFLTDAAESAPGTLPFVLPTGTVSFVLTDIEGSTRLWHEHPDVAGAAVARHYEIIGAAVDRHGGVRPVEQGEGDSVVAAFARSADALAAALDAQRGLLAEPWPEGVAVRVRMAGPHRRRGREP